MVLGNLENVQLKEMIRHLGIRFGKMLRKEM